MTIDRRRTLGLFAVTALSVLILAVASPPADAAGGGPAECSTGLQASGDGDLQTYNAPEGFIVSGVCIKAGQLHTQLYPEDFLGLCYSGSGIGTQTVEVVRVGITGPSCQDISHVDVLIEERPPTTTTTAPSSTTTTTEETTTTTTQPTTTTTTEPSTTTTAPSSTTTTEDPSTTTTAPASTTTEPEDPTTSPTLPFTGPGDDVGLLALAASALVGLGLAALKSARD